MTGRPGCTEGKAWGAPEGRPREKTPCRWLDSCTRLQKRGLAAVGTEESEASVRVGPGGERARDRLKQGQTETERQRDRERHRG